MYVIMDKTNLRTQKKSILLHSGTVSDLRVDVFRCKSHQGRPSWGVITSYILFSKQYKTRRDTCRTQISTKAMQIMLYFDSSSGK